MKRNFEPGKTYYVAMGGQILTFVFNELDPEDKEVIWITWATGEEEGYSIEEISPYMDEYEIITAAGGVYPKGDSEEAQAEGLAELIAQPTYIFAGMEVPRSFVLTDHFSPSGYRPDHEYMDFIFDQDKQILTMTTPDPDAAVPQWLIERFPVVGILKVDPSNNNKKTTFIIELKSKSSKQVLHFKDLDESKITRSDIMHTFVLGKPGRGRALRSLNSFADYWGKQIPDEFKKRADEYFSASEAEKILRFKNESEGF